MMKPSLVTLTIGQSPRSDILPLLQEHLPADAVAHAGLLDGLTLAEVEQLYAPAPGDKVLVSRMSSGEQVRLAAATVEQGLQRKITALEQQGYDTILLLCTGEFGTLKTTSALLLEPDRIIPPLVASIVDGHQVGIILPVPELMPAQARKWQVLENPPHYSLANPFYGTEEELIGAGRDLLSQGADVLLLDCLGFHQKHRDLLQKALDVPVLLSNVLVARLASELLV